MDKKICATCNSAIVGSMMSARGKNYHPDHFTCGSCQRKLGVKFYEMDGLPTCENCYNGSSQRPRCEHCSEQITDKAVNALGKRWHVEHFMCAACSKPFYGGNFYERDGKAYCETDYMQQTAARCAGCKEPINGEALNVLNQQWHPDHFVCTTCAKPLSGRYFDSGGKPYCEQHFHTQSGSTCGGCGKVIIGAYVNGLEKEMAS